MPHVVVSLDVAAPAAATWERLTDWPAHGRWVPLTTVRVTSAAPRGLGARFVGRTGVGPLAFDDPMEVVESSPPVGDEAGTCRVVKSGRVVLGSARFDVAPTPSGSRVTWTYDVDLAPVRLTRPFRAVTGRAVAAGVRRALQAMAREVEREQAAL